MCDGDLELLSRKKIILNIIKNFSNHHLEKKMNYWKN